MTYPSVEVFSTPVDAGYTALVGHAVYAFGYLEWQIVHLGEKLKPGFIYTAEKKTAGRVASDFETIANNKPMDPILRPQICSVASRFIALVVKRNRLAHAHPATIRGHQRLNYWSTTVVFTWESDDVVVLINDIESLAKEANRLYYDSRLL